MPKRITCHLGVQYIQAPEYRRRYIRYLQKQMACKQESSRLAQAGSPVGAPPPLQFEALPEAGVTNPLSRDLHDPFPSSFEKPAGRPSASLLAQANTGETG